MSRPTPAWQGREGVMSREHVGRRRSGAPHEAGTGAVCARPTAHEPLHDLGRRDQCAMGDSMQWTRARRQRQPTARWQQTARAHHGGRREGIRSHSTWPHRNAHTATKQRSSAQYRSEISETVTRHAQRTPSSVQKGTTQVGAKPHRSKLVWCTAVQFAPRSLIVDSVVVSV